MYQIDDLSVLLVVDQALGCDRLLAEAGIGHGLRGPVIAGSRWVCLVLNRCTDVDVLVALGLEGLALGAVGLGRGDTDIVDRIIAAKDDDQHDGDRNRCRDADGDEVGPAMFLFLARLLRFLGQPPLLFLMKFLAHGQRGYQQD